ncbi:hypothetical protein, partial [Micromonospora fulviviridis]
MPVTAWPEMPLNTVHDTAVELPGAVALRWLTRQGPVHVVWPLPHERRRATHQEWVRQLAPRGEGAVVVVSGGFSPHRGPELKGLLPGLPGRTYSPAWTRLAEVLGQPLPWWPMSLPDRRLLLDWSPATPTVTTMAASELDTGALLMMASAYSDTHPAARVLVNLARVAHARAAAAPEQMVEMVERADLPDGALRIAAPSGVGASYDRDEPHAAVGGGHGQGARRAAST